MNIGLTTIDQNQLMIYFF